MQAKLGKKDRDILCHLRNNARITLTDLSRKTGIPVSTIFERIRSQEKGLISRHTALLDFDRLGYRARANIAISVERSQKESLSEFLRKHQNINSVYRLASGYDFMAESVFESLTDLEDFREMLEDRFPIKSIEVYYIVSDLKREGFFSAPETAEIAGSSIKIGDRDLQER